jgi:aspartyl/glutamyl-tRNA(Asn/Gln) amidotransferase C subunit
MKLSREEVQHLAALARLRLTDEEQTQLAGQLSRILEFMDKLNQVEPEEFLTRARPIDITIQPQFGDPEAIALATANRIAATTFGL